MKFLRSKIGELSLFLILFVVIQTFLWKLPFIAFSLILFLSIFLLWRCKSITNSIIFIIIGIIGPLSELFQIKLGILEYNIFGEGGFPSLLGHLPIWIPFSWGIAAVIILELSPEIIKLLLKYDKGEVPNKKNIIFKILSIILLTLFILISLAFSQNTSSAILIILIGFMFFEYLRRNIDDRVFFIVGLLVGLLAEGILLQTKIYWYSGFSLFNIPIWMILIWGIIAIIIYRVSMILDYFFKRKTKQKTLFKK